jgi:hypothetical protein
MAFERFAAGFGGCIQRLGDSSERSYILLDGLIDSIRNDFVSRVAETGDFCQCYEASPRFVAPPAS